MSNCINSDINKMYCLTQFNSASLNRHLSQAYNNNVGSYNRQGFVEVLAAQQSPKNKDWFQGTADAVRQYIWLFNESKCDEYIILSGDHLYRMDYKPFIVKHRQTRADITVSAVPMDEERAAAELQPAGDRAAAVVADRVLREPEEAQLRAAARLAQRGDERAHAGVAERVVSDVEELEVVEPAVQ